MRKHCHVQYNTYSYRMELQYIYCECLLHIVTVNKYDNTRANSDSLNETRLTKKDKVLIFITICISDFTRESAGIVYTNYYRLQSVYSLSSHGFDMLYLPTVSEHFNILTIS